ncbi:MAG: hypothetical protein LBU61_02205, partial [Coriobacteriales bacterium]|nr:hypothetical protein [Coriobacteriales bacterium]
GIVACVTQVASLVGLFFGIESAQDYTEVKQSDTGLYAQYFRAMLARNIYLAPSQFEAMFISAAHNLTDINQTLEQAELALLQLQKAGLA